jgi:hypothetical protein
MSWGLGPQVSFSHRFGTSIVGIGATGSVSFNNTPWAVYGMNAAGGYELRDSGADLVFLYRLAVAFHLHAHERLLIMAGPAVANHVTNVGFSDADLEGSTITSNTHGFIPFVGLRYIDPSGFFAQAQMMFPVGFDSVDITPITGSFSLGFAFGEKPQPEPEPEPEPIPMTPAPAVPPPPPATYTPVPVAPAAPPQGPPPPPPEEKYESAEPMP